MLVLKNARLIPELTEDFDGTCADIVIDGGVIAVSYTHLELNWGPMFLSVLWGRLPLILCCRKA